MNIITITILTGVCVVFCVGFNVGHAVGLAAANRQFRRWVNNYDPNSKPEGGYCE